MYCHAKHWPTNQVNYGKDFEVYLETLMTGLCMMKKSIIEVFRQWNWVIFPNSDSSLVHQEQDATSSGLQMMITGLNKDEKEED